MFRRKTVLDSMIRRKFAVTLSDNGEVFTGFLVEQDPEMLVFDDCWMQTREGTQRIEGRTYVYVINVHALQELSGG